MNLYAAGDTVYLRGKNFTVTTAFSWAISGLPGGASGDPGLVVDSGTGTTDGSGAFCVAAYVVASNDWGEYTADVTQGRTSKNDNYHVNGTGGTTDPGTGGTTDPGTGGTTDPGTGTGGTNIPDGSTVDTGSTNPSQDVATVTDPTDPTTSADSTSTPLSQTVLGEIDLNPSSIELPPTDTLDTTSGPVAPSILIVGLSALAGLALLFAPRRQRREDEQG